LSKNSFRLKPPLIENLSVISPANDTIGYICHRQAYEEVEYEPGRGTNLTEGAGKIITEHPLNIIKRMNPARRRRVGMKQSRQYPSRVAV